MTQDKSPQDDLDWLTTLAGKSEGGQGARLRQALRDIEQVEAAQEDTTQDWERLRFAIRREQAQQKSTLRYVALAASLLIFVSTLRMMMPMEETVPGMEAATVMRGTAEQVILSANPKQEADQLQSELLRLGAQVVRRDSPAKVELHVTLVHPVSESIRALLEANTIPLPEQGDLKIVLISQPE